MPTIAETEFLQHPSIYLDAVHRGENLILSEHGEPTAMVIPLVSRSEPRPFGLYKGQIHLAEDFNDPLPEDILESFTAALNGK